MKTPCENHEDFATRIARIEEKVSLVLVSINRLEERIYQGHGAISTVSSSIKTTMTVAGIGVAFGVALVKLIGYVSG